MRITVNTSSVTQGKLTVFADFGKDYPSMQPAKLQELATRIKAFTNGVDIQNYMSDEGWEYLDKQVQHESRDISSKTIIASSHDVFYTYTFRKLKL